MARPAKPKGNGSAANLGFEAKLCAAADALRNNMWFTLCHELAHVARHFDGGETEAFFDDLDLDGLDAIRRKDPVVRPKASHPSIDPRRADTQRET